MKIQKRQISFLPKKLLKKTTPSFRVKVKIGPLALDLRLPKFLWKCEVLLSFLLSWLAVGPPRGGLQKVGSYKSSSGLFTLNEGTQSFCLVSKSLLLKFSWKYMVHLFFLSLSWLVVGLIKGDLQKIESNKSSFGLFTLNEGQTFLRPDQKSLCRPVCKPSVHFEASLFALGSFSTFRIWATLCHQLWSCDDCQNPFQTKKSRFFMSRSNKAVVVHCSSFLFSWSFQLCPWFFFLHFFSLSWADDQNFGPAPLIKQTNKHTTAITFVARSLKSVVVQCASIFVLGSSCIRARLCHPLWSCEDGQNFEPEP